MRRTLRTDYRQSFISQSVFLPRFASPPPLLEYTIPSAPCLKPCCILGSSCPSFSILTHTHTLITHHDSDVSGRPPLSALTSAALAAAQILIPTDAHLA